VRLGAGLAGDGAHLQRDLQPRGRLLCPQADLGGSRVLVGPMQHRGCQHVALAFTWARSGCGVRRHTIVMPFAPIGAARDGLLRIRRRLRAPFLQGIAVTNDKTGVGPDALDLDAFVPFRLLRTTNRITSLAARLYAEQLDISIAESRVVNLIASRGPMSTHEISALTGMDRPKVTRATQSLVQTGRLARHVNPDDKRLIRLVLTAKGRKLHEGVLRILRHFEAEVDAALGPKETARILELLDRLDRHFGTREGESGPTEVTDD
jgi:DNA-binding MarR family transcriptional regulator